MGTSLHADMQLFYKLHADKLKAAGISYDDVVHATGQVRARPARARGARACLCACAAPGGVPPSWAHVPRVCV
jgi:hypothetical protein